MEFAYFHFDLKAFSGLPPFCLVCSAHACVLTGRRARRKSSGCLALHLINIQCFYICIRNYLKDDTVRLTPNTYIHAVYHRTVVYLISDSLSQSESPNAR